MRLNKIILIGRLTRNPETRYTVGTHPTAVTWVGMAVNRPYKKADQQEADFFNLVSFGQKAEYMNKYGRKGRLTSIVGYMKQDHWEDQQKVKHTSWSVVIEEITFLDKAQGTTPEAEAATT